MTRARAVKQTIRARAQKTGERYTTARRHVLKGMAAPSVPPAARLGDASSRRAAATSAPLQQPPAGVSDDKVLQKTGHGITHWFEVLDRFGAMERGHTAAARHLREAHEVDAWYAQGITVAYERARGLRAVNQRRSGEFEVSVSKVLIGDVETVIRAVTDARRRRQWTIGAAPEVEKELAAALDAPAAKSFALRPNGQGRFRYRSGTATVEFYLQPRSGGKVSLVVQHSKLSSAAIVDARRGQWKSALNALAAHLQKKAS